MDYLKEILKVDNSDINMITKQKSKLSEKFWTEDKELKPKIRTLLINISQKFIEFMKFPSNIEIKDIRFTGSLANYNYTPFSDIDLHIIVDGKDIGLDDNNDNEYLSDLVKNKTYMFNQKYDFRAYNHEIELYVEVEGEEHFSDGIYSVLNNNWVVEPDKEVVVVNNDLVKQKVEIVSTIIDKLSLEKHSVKDIENVKDKLKKMRKSGLEKEGIFSPENLTYKILRNNGYLDKLANKKIEIQNKELSI